VPFPYAMWFKNADAFHDPNFYFQEYHHPDGAWGEALGFRNGYADPDGMAALIEAAEVETDEEARYELYGQLQQRVYEEPNWLWMAEEANLQIFRCWINNFVYNPLWVVPRVALYDKG
jgi:peptide/nickel transport system substrate-binding protein